MSTHEKPATPASQSDPFGLERLVFFSDAVFAIAITLLALDIRLPAATGPVTNASLLQSLLSIFPKYLGFAISFLVIGGFWITHHRRYRHIRRYDGRLLSINLLFLMIIAFIPFPTAVLSEYGNRTATIFYALTIAFAGIFSGLVWWYASYHNRLIDAHLDARQRRQETWHALILPGIFLISIGLAFINDDLAKYSWILAAMGGQVLR